LITKQTAAAGVSRPHERMNSNKYAEYNRHLSSSNNKAPNGAAAAAGQTTVDRSAAISPDIVLINAINTAGSRLIIDNNNLSNVVSSEKRAAAVGRGGAVGGSGGGGPPPPRYIGQPTNGLTDIEAAILRSHVPIDVNETEEIVVNGERGIWTNKAENLNWKGAVPLSQYTINDDPNPEIIRKKTSQQLVYQQEVAIRLA
jgi:hypothetical protein